MIEDIRQMLEEKLMELQLLQTRLRAETLAASEAQATADATYLQILELSRFIEALRRYVNSQTAPPRP